MSLSVTESEAVNELIRWICDQPSAIGRKVTDVQAREAAKTLAASANKRLMAGVRPADVERSWPKR